MDITHLSIRNFLTNGSADLELDSRGLLLIQGQNDDDTSASSNGAGKSSIVDAICWCLYGSTARDVSGDDVVNALAKKDCMVKIVLNDNGTEYSITRHRKDKVHKNALYVYQLDPSKAIDLSKGTDRETQEVVRKIMGCSLDVFIGAIYAGQEKMPDLPGMTDKQLKLLIEEAAGVEELADAYQEASKRALVAKKDFDAAAAHVKSLQQRLSVLEGEVLAHEGEHKRFEDGRKDRARAELAKVKPLQDKTIGGEAAVRAYDEPALTKRKGEIEAKLASHKTQQDALAALQRKAHLLDREVAKQRGNIDTEKKRIERQKQELADIESQIGKPCGECGKAYCEHDLDAARAARQSSINAALANLRLNVEACKKAMAELAAAKQAADDFAATMTDVSAVSKELTQINVDLATVARLRAEISNWERQIEQVKVNAKAKLTETNPWTKAVQAKQADYLRTKADIEAAQKQCAELERQADLYADAAKVFGPAGVRAHILDTVTPFLNEKTSDYLGALADGNIHATWSTLAPTAKGDLKEKFNIDVANDKGGKSFKALSGGEKRKVRIASNMALQDMVASRAEKPINLWIGDEIDHALDEPGLERLMTVLDRKAKERGTVIVISHNSLSDWIDNVIHVKKAGGVSTVSGATHRGF